MRYIKRGQKKKDTQAGKFAMGSVHTVESLKSILEKVALDPSQSWRRSRPEESKAKGQEKGWRRGLRGETGGDGSFVVKSPSLEPDRASPPRRNSSAGA